MCPYNKQLCDNKEWKITHTVKVDTSQKYKVVTYFEPLKSIEIKEYCYHQIEIDQNSKIAPQNDDYMIMRFFKNSANSYIIIAKTLQDPYIDICTAIEEDDQFFVRYPYKIFTLY